jgi:acetyl esterase/lipase
MLSLACLACTLVLRPLAGLGPVASLAAGAATALSFLIVTMIQLAIIGAGGALAPQLGLSLAPIGSGAPDLRETFVTPDGARLTHSIYKPAGGYRIPTPMLLYVHGGGWIGGDPDGSAHDLRWFADHGWLVISLDYRLASPTHPTWNSATSDVVCGLDWAAANAERLGGDVSHIAVVGDSAGGTLALTASYAIAAGSRVSVCTGPHPKVGAVVAGSPVIDLKHSYEHGLPQPGREPTNFIVRYLGGPPAQHPDRVAAVSPAHYLAKGAPPTLLIVPAQDTFIPPEGSDGFVAAARAAEVPVERVDIPFAGHTFYHRAAGSVGNYGYLTIIRSYLTKRGLAPR